MKPLPKEKIEQGINLPYVERYTLIAQTLREVGDRYDHDKIKEAKSRLRSSIVVATEVLCLSGQYSAEELDRALDMALAEFLHQSMEMLEDSP